MKKIDVGQTISILANIGVITGIIFLGIEVRQNNELLAAQARRDLLDARTAVAALRLNNEELMRLEFKSITGEEITEYEEFRLDLLGFVIVSQMEWQFDEFRAGALAESDLPVDGWTRRFGSFPALLRYWEDGAGKRGRSPEFIRFIEQRVLNEL